MSTVINTNINALIAERNLSALSTQYQQSVERLSSGLRINRAADDAAGLAISQNLEAQVNGLNQAQSNAQDGMSMVQTAEGALNEVQAMLQRMSELAVEAANGTLGPSDLQSVASEMTALTSEIDRISNSTTFNGLNLLNGNLATQLTTSGLTAYNNVTVNSSNYTTTPGLLVTTGATPNVDALVSNIDASGAQSGTTYLLASGTQGTDTVVTLYNASSASAATASQTIDLTKLMASGNNTVTLDFNQLGISMSLEVPPSTAVVTSAGLTASASLSAGTIAGDLNASKLVTASGNQSATLQIGANASDTLAISFAMVNSTSLGISTNSSFQGFTTNPTNAEANALISVFDNAINQVSTIRGNFGATENRLQHTVNSLSVASENLTASQSRIQDLDVASEMVNFTKLQILQQAGVSVLAQANQSPSYVLKLLQ